MKAPKQPITLTGIEVCTPKESFGIIHQIFYNRVYKVDLDKEHVWTICLAASRKIFAIELVSAGREQEVHTRLNELFELALDKRCTHLVIVRNRPSGQREPSGKDIEETNRLIKAGLLLDIEVIDHVIIDEHGFYSFHDHGLIDDLKHDPSFFFSFIQEKVYRKEVEELKGQMKRQAQEAREKQAIFIAEKMLKDGRTLQEVYTYTQLSLPLLEKIMQSLQKTDQVPLDQEEDTP